MTLQHVTLGRLNVVCEDAAEIAAYTAKAQAAGFAVLFQEIDEDNDCCFFQIDYGQATPRVVRLALQN